jgi:hypothetical protein
LSATMHEIVGLAEQAGPESALGTAILERCRAILATAQARPQAPDAPDQNASGEIQFL